MSIATEFARQIILAVFFILIIIVAVRLGILFRMKKNESEKNLKKN